MRIQYGDCSRTEALDIIRTHTPGQRAAVLPILEATTEAWLVHMYSPGRGTIKVKMQLGRSAHLLVTVTGKGEIKELRVWSEGAANRILAPDHVEWPEPVPTKRDWPSAAAEWVKARTGDVPAPAAIQYRIDRLTTECQSARSEAGARRRQADELDTRADTVALQIRELKAELHSAELDSAPGR